VIALDTPYSSIIDEGRLLVLHAQGLKIGGVGKGSKASDGCLSGALGNAWTAEQYSLDERAEPLGLLFAVYLFDILLRAHCFVDGNKRVAWLALVHVLAQYNVEPDFDDTEVRDFCNSMLDPKSKRSIDEILDWLVPNLKPLNLKH
jgi:prophage maintenance system killer protein